jgi:rhodanese-related sulfurtransferase
VILEIRREALRASDPRLLPGARRLVEADLSSTAFERLATELAGQSVVVVCAEEHGRSQDTAAWLRHLRVAAEYLEGGQASWEAAGPPVINPSRITAQDDQGRSLWVTRSRPKIDRVACPWFICRFVDPRAVFLYVAATEVASVAERCGAMPYDIEGAFWATKATSAPSTRSWSSSASPPRPSTGWP